jgi:hypothetical protein
MRKVLAIVTLCALSAAPSYCAPNKKFFKKAADKVWAMNLPEFDAKKVIPDSLLNNSSAVIIAAYDNANLNLVQNASSNRTEEELIYRSMVKILDKSALDYYSTFEFSEGKGKTITINGKPFTDYKSAFGARIYKSDGRVIDVNTDESVPVTTGKNSNKTLKYKIAIAGLEIGDIIEYFYYDENWVDQFSIKPLRFDCSFRYPTMTYIMEGDVNKEFVVEYRSYNDAPEVRFVDGSNNQRHFETKITDIPASESGIGLLPMRQNPFVKMFVTNPSALLEYHPSTSRGAGIYHNLMPGIVYQDILTALRSSRYESSLPNKTIKTVKEFIKQHPDADKNTIVDAAWLALNYYNLIEDEDEEDLWMSIMFCDIISKLKIDATTSVAFLNSRNDVATNQIISWRQPDYLAIVDDRYFLPGVDCRVPGEIPGDYQGEEGATFRGDIKASTQAMFPDVITAPTTQTKQNQHAVTSEASIDGSEIKLHQKTVLTGSCKEDAESAVYFEDWIADVENYLGIPENKRYEVKSGDKEEHAKEIEKYLTEEIVIGPDVTPNVNKVEVESRGILPNSPSFTYTVDCTIDGLVSEAGNDLIVNVGKLFGDNYVLSDSEREHRVNDVYATSPSDTKYRVHLNLPDGYTIKEGTLDDINGNCTTAAGQFFSQAKYNESTNAIDLTTLFRVSHYLVGADYWGDVVKLLDAAAKYNSATIVLTQK